MRTKYETIEFEVEAERLDSLGAEWRGRLRRTGNIDVVVVLVGFEGRARAYNIYLTAAEHRDIAHFLGQLNQEGKPK